MNEKRNRRQVRIEIREENREGKSVDGKKIYGEKKENGEKRQKK